MGLITRWLIIAAMCTRLNSVYSSDDSHFSIDDEDGILSVPDLIQKYGYEMESHTVVTEDGYGLTMFRLLPKEPLESTKNPVLMVHGLLASPADFIIIGPNNSLAYLLADNGYDVWLANVRGTRFSKKHSSLSLHSKEYWSFSWHEIGYYDLPAMIEYVLNTTNAKKLHYIGFSQGATVYFAMATTRPEYNDKISLMVALSPPIFVRRVRSPIMTLLANTLKELLKMNNSSSDFECFPHSPLYRLLTQSICAEDNPTNFCSKFISLIVGPDPDAYNQTVMTAYVGHTPAGASFNQIIHYAQIARSGSFHQFDYGRKLNLLKYGSKKPPAYNLELATAPVLMYYGLNDWLVHPRSVLELAKVLPRVVAAEQVADKQFNHIDFILAKNVRSLLYDQAIQMIDKFNS
ncbi:lipase 1-like [Armigeres subalbatus]|uniref:lipase 1-like n=1 Tax=Armigeres subalbatus TaxID=124917 RepID=UPI002ED2D342